MPSCARSTVVKCLLTLRWSFYLDHWNDFDWQWHIKSGYYHSYHKLLPLLLPSEVLYIFWFSQDWASECPDVKNYKWRLNADWHRMLYSCTYMATVSVKVLNLWTSHKLVVSGWIWKSILIVMSSDWASGGTSGRWDKGDSYRWKPRRWCIRYVHHSRWSGVYYQPCRPVHQVCMIAR